MGKPRMDADPPSWSGSFHDATGSSRAAVPSWIGIRGTISCSADLRFVHAESVKARGIRGRDGDGVHPVAGGIKWAVRWNVDGLPVHRGQGRRGLKFKTASGDLRDADLNGARGRNGMIAGARAWISAGEPFESVWGQVEVRVVRSV